MCRYFKEQTLVIAAVILPLLFAPVPTEAGGKNSNGAKDKRHDDSSQTWQSRQGGSGEPGKQKQNGKQRYQTQDQGRARTTIRHRLRDDDIYGREMMTRRELENYRARLDSAKNDREWVRLRAEHQRQMEQRASQRGVAIDPAVYGQHMMTREERLRFNQRLSNATSAEQREGIRNEHRLMIEQRARELGLEGL